MEEYSRVMNYEATILIPFLKPDVFFMKAISSIRKSLLIDMEILLIGPADLNKGEKLFVSEICEKSQLDFRVIFASTSNVAQALNIGLKNIETEFIIRFDSDDIMLPSRIPNQLSYLKQNPDVVVVGGQISLISKSGLPVIWPRIHYPTDKYELRRKMLQGCYLAHPSVTMRTEAVRSLGGYREWFDSAEDYDLWLRILKIGELANLGEKVIKYRQHKNQASRKFTDVSRFTKAALESYLGDEHHKITEF